MTARSGIAQPLRGGSVYVGVGERLLELRDCRPEERRIPFQRLLFERDLVDRSHELSLFTAHFEREARNGADDYPLTGIDSLRAVRPPGLAAHAHASGGPAIVDGYPLGSDERLRSDPRRAALGAADQEGRLAELDRQADEDRDDAPARRQDEERERDGKDERDLIDDQDRRPDRDMVEQPGRVGDQHPDAPVRGRVADRRCVQAFRGCPTPGAVEAHPARPERVARARAGSASAPSPSRSPVGATRGSSACRRSGSCRSESGTPSGRSRLGSSATGSRH